MSFDLCIRDGDLVLEGGDLKQVYNTDKLIQDILKIVLTPVGGNPLFPFYGSFISKTLVGSSLPNNITIQVTQSQLQNAIEILMLLQKAQIKSFQSVSPDELINSILDISINRNQFDPTVFNVSIKVLTKGLKAAGANFTVNI